MARELRLAFAMGGGVSLGTFSGAALSEAIKLAVRYGVGSGRYDHIVVDVFSGASAGAMALALMLRGLVHRSSDAEGVAQARLHLECGEAFAHCPESLRRDLTAAQVVQDLEEDVWVREVTLERLLGDGEDATTQAGLLDRRAVEQLAWETLRFDEAIPLEARLRHRRLLGDRVLFACTLANLHPIQADARGQWSTGSLGCAGLADGLTSHLHRETRVFDLRFTQAGTGTEHPIAAERVHPSRWRRYHAGEAVPGRIGDLRENRAWAEIAATTVASGAFPLAFQPVPLRRAAHEFGPFWPDSLLKAGIEEFPFSYVDGGLFNNEPIREALRLATFLDDITPGQAFDRLVLFVDPNVSTTGTPLYALAPMHQAFELQQGAGFPFGRALKAVRQGTLERLAPLAASVARAVLDESRVVEADRVYHELRCLEQEQTACTQPACPLPQVPGAAPHVPAGHIHVAAMAPMRQASDATLPIPLPGAALGGFAGFMSEIPGAFEVRVGRWCAKESLRRTGLLPIPPDTTSPVFHLSETEVQRMKNDMNRGLAMLAARAGKLIREAGVLRGMPGGGLIAKLLARVVQRKVRALGKRALEQTRGSGIPCELRIHVPKGDIRLRAAANENGGIAPVKTDATGPWQLIVPSLYDPQKSQEPWHRFGAQQGLLELREKGFLRSAAFCRIRMPEPDIAEQMRLRPNPRLVLTLTPKDRGQEVPAERWRLEDGVTPLAKTLLPAGQ